MNNYLTEDTLNDVGASLMNSLFGFLPEVIICVGIVWMLIYRLSRGSHKVAMGNFALTFTILAFLFSLLQWLGKVSIFGFPLETLEIGNAAAGTGTGAESGYTLFSGLLMYDHLTVYFRLFLYGFTILVIWLTRLTGIPDREDSADFHTLLLGAVLGMVLMSSANHLLMIFMAIEMASLPSYALAGFLKGRRQSSEAALKYVVYGGGAAGVMLYGISLIVGRFGTGYLPDVAHGIGQAMVVNGQLQFDPIVILGLLFILVGIAFKLSAFPFHFWCPDVFEGASAEVAGFLSVASKGAALALLVRIVFYICGVDFARQAGFGSDGMTQILVPALCLLAIATATFGNLAAYRQTNLKRLLAYSTIAHAGYMIMGVAVARGEGARAVLFYLAAYLLMNLGAFAIVAFFRNLTGSEDLSGYRGLIRRSPGMVVIFCVFLLSLLGIPPLIGFVAKFQIFGVLVDSARAYSSAGDTTVSGFLWTTLVFGAINSVISAVYYIKVMKVMILDTTLEEIEGTEAAPLPVPKFYLFYGSLLALGVIAGGLWWGPIQSASAKGLSDWKKKPVVPTTRVPVPGAGGGRR